MRVYEKKRLINIVKSINDNLEAILTNTSDIITSEIIDILTLCQESVITLGEFIETNVEGIDNEITILEQVCDDIFRLSQNWKDFTIIEKIVFGLNVIEEKIESYKTDKAIIYFLPYKVSMWDSFESVYAATVKDNRCEAYVMPIPYYEKENSNRIYHWEYDKFEKNINLVDYHDCDLSMVYPDVIYIHNPYDDANRVSEVENSFFSNKLKECTDMLVYIPYYISGMYKNEQRLLEKLFLPGAKNSDIVICQAQIQKDVYKKFWMDSDKYVVCGNPKFDVLINYMKNNQRNDIRKCYGFNEDKIILLNTSIAYFLNKEKWIEVYSAFFDECMNKQINILWRPHPLLESSIKSIRPEVLDDYKALVEKINSSNNIRIDKEATPIPALHLADALISDYSSLVYQFYVTGKPLYSVDGVAKYREEGIVIFDYYDAYLRSEKVSLSEFVDLVISGEDYKKEQRETVIEKYAYLSTGEVGDNIHRKISEKLF